MEKAGIPVHVPRASQEPFHATLAVVGKDFPIDEALQVTCIFTFCFLPRASSC